MTTLNEIVKTYATCLFWIIASGCASFLIGYLIGYNTTTYPALKMAYALNGGLMGAAIVMLGTLVICMIVIYMKGDKEQRTATFITVSKVIGVIVGTFVVITIFAIILAAIRRFIG